MRTIPVIHKDGSRGTKGRQPEQGNHPAQTLEGGRMKWIVAFIGLMMIVVVLFAFIFFLFDVLNLIMDLIHTAFNYIAEKIKREQK